MITITPMKACRGMEVSSRVWYTRTGAIRAAVSPSRMCTLPELLNEPWK